MLKCLWNYVANVYECWLHYFTYIEAIDMDNAKLHSYSYIPSRGRSRLPPDHVTDYRGASIAVLPCI